jgi:hypothetical protein
MSLFVLPNFFIQRTTVKFCYKHHQAHPSGVGFAIGADHGS